MLNVNLCFKALWCVVFAVVCMGCSSKQVYTALNEHEKTECNKLPPPQNRQCLEQNDQSYEEYRRSREAVKGD